jgi:hypothetical protein
MPTGQASRGGKAAPRADHMDKNRLGGSSSERTHRSGFKLSSTQPTATTWILAELVVVKLHVRVHVVMTIMWTQTCAASGLGPTTARTRPQTKYLNA